MADIYWLIAELKTIPSNYRMGFWMVPQFFSDKNLLFAESSKPTHISFAQKYFPWGLQRIRKYWRYWRELDLTFG